MLAVVIIGRGEVALGEEEGEVAAFFILFLICWSVVPGYLGLKDQKRRERGARKRSTKEPDGDPNISEIEGDANRMGQAQLFVH